MGEAGGGLQGNPHRRPCMEVPVKPRRPPSLPLICKVFPEYSSFSVLRETSMTFPCDHFKKPKCYGDEDRRVGFHEGFLRQDSGTGNKPCGCHPDRFYTKFDGLSRTQPIRTLLTGPFQGLRDNPFTDSELVSSELTNERPNLINETEFLRQDEKAE